jgi:hypothetical protein
VIEDFSGLERVLLADADQHALQLAHDWGDGRVDRRASGDASDLSTDASDVLSRVPLGRREIVTEV